jgi:hypothetical protein
MVAITFNEVTDMVRVLVWPTVVVIVVVVLRAAISDVLRRFRRAGYGPDGAVIECESGGWHSYVADSELATPIEHTDPPPQGDETDDAGDETDEAGD